MSVPASDPIRIAVAQAESAPGELAHNAATTGRLLDQAAADGVRLAVFGELFLPAYHLGVLAAEPQRCDVVCDESDLVDEPRLDPVRAAARDHAIVAVIGASVRRPDGARRCSALVADSTGGIRVAYDKQNLCGPDERSIFSPGESGASLHLDGWRFGLGICYDGCFPEHARAAALDGAHGYLCPSGYVVGGEPRRDLYYAARALDNTFYVGFANLVGGPPPWGMNGGSAIYDPQGQPVRRADNTSETLVVADLQPAELARVRARQTMLADAGHAARSSPRRTVRLG